MAIGIFQECFEKALGTFEHAENCSRMLGSICDTQFSWTTKLWIVNKKKNCLSSSFNGFGFPKATTTKRSSILSINSTQALLLPETSISTSCFTFSDVINHKWTAAENTFS
ncbi:CLUMA_CG010099, isoform A [Clunio marinus]|uniref:CLUMA_CG010099, isoform A n=1 Tax=Clunio marinus TaxID=568069 RepID=A0A1J1ID35_9DIPT|nr:CLUMA_CG010099, isoform A [Clunio marinus]